MKCFRINVINDFPAFIEHLLLTHQQFFCQQADPMRVTRSESDRSIRHQNHDDLDASRCIRYR
ncbi:hypothetical protein [Holospora curviuscula]|nr:hypothetical protein [Holospora curviuscula]